jgi:hypothetical protein
MFASSILHPIFKQDNMFECIKVIILPTTTNSLFKDLINKSIYVDLKSLILLHKSQEKVIIKTMILKYLENVFLIARER